ncbi:MAG TPA: ABC transporter permease [bacterium]|nr:ABC transporter permease [bacterium]
MGAFAAVMSAGLWSGPREVIRRLTRSGGALFGLAVMSGVLAVALLAPVLAPYDPVRQDLLNQNLQPSALHWFGTDRLGRDIFSRVLWGARPSLVTGVGAVLVGAVQGSVLGLLAGYYGGWVDGLLARLVDTLMAFPLYLSAIFVVAVLGPSQLGVVLAVGIAVTPAFARLARGQVLEEREKEYVLAARAIGGAGARVIVSHILPNIVAPLLVLASLNIGDAILVEAGLSFLGLGPPPPTPSWGLMVNDGIVVLTRAPWVSLCPGVAVALLVFGSNLLGDGLRDALDPRLRGQG